MWPIFIINLDRATERRVASEALLRGLGLDFVRIPACDWQRLTPAELEAHTSPRPPLFAKRRLSPAEVACFMSHLAVWRTIAADDAPGAFIFEDDFTIAPSFRDVAAAVSSRVPDWDILKFYSNKQKLLLQAEPLAAHYRIGTPRVIPMSTIAYAITRPAAARLAAVSLPFKRPVDLFIKHWWEHGACVKLVLPSPVGRIDDHLASSEIHPARQFQGRRDPVSRFLNNVLYQLAFKGMSALHAGKRPTRRSWLDAHLGERGEEHP